MNQNQLNKKQEEKEEKRLSKIIKEVYDILLEDKNMTVNEAVYRDWETDRTSTRLNSSHRSLSRMPSSA